jgi:Domain of unknown function (DUF4387)
MTRTLGQAVQFIRSKNAGPFGLTIDVFLATDADYEAVRRSQLTDRKSFLDNYKVHQVGGQTILEYWIPAGDLPALNASIVGRIELVSEYH